MSEFRTDFKIEGLPKKLDHNSKLFFIGSCFTENIGGKLIEYKFNTELNPFGILYNPVSIKNSLDYIIDKKIYKESDLFYSNNLWASYYHHSKFSDPDKDKCLDKINKTIPSAYEYLQQSTFLYITLGTAKVYKLKSSGKIVSNCHKQASKEFETNFLNTEDIVEDYTKLINRIIDFNPSIKIVFTISPVRHWQDGVTQNQLSKSTLIIAANKLCKLFANVFYFPAYEIMMDDLRDYRFYKEDMIHPNQVAIDYIWKKFSELMIKKESIELCIEIDRINKAFSHKPFNPKSPDHKSFLAKNHNNIIDILEKFPDLDFSREISYFSGN